MDDAFVSELKKEFEHEAEILANLRHPNILTFYGGCIISPNFALITEFCDNGALYDCLHGRKGKKIPWAKLHEIGLGICRGLNYLHHRKIIHRDIKSQNILSISFN